MSAAAAHDDEELQALFDGIVAGDELQPVIAAGAIRAATAQTDGAGKSLDLLNKIGRLTRTIHDSLRELGYDKKLGAAAATIPDARERLAYVATMTERAAVRVMNATDVARPIQQRLSADARALAERWRSVFTGEVGVEQFRTLSAATLEYLESVPQHTQQTNAQLTEIVLAQDFQDLTGQVIKRISDLAHHLETELLALLLEHMPADHRCAGTESLLNGPVVSAERAGDVVSTQAQVDDLLESLGF